jgi:hypothetical protein
MLKKIIPVLVAVALTAAFTLPNAQTKAAKALLPNAKKPKMNSNQFNNN